MSKTDKIIELKKLLDSGLINQSDFYGLKKQIFEGSENASNVVIKSIQPEFKDSLQSTRISNSVDTNSTKRCPQCGSENKIENSYCKICKTELNLFEKKGELIPENYSNTSKYVFICFFLILFLTVGAVYYNSGSKSDDNIESSETINDTTSTAPAASHKDNSENKTLTNLNTEDSINGTRAKESFDSNSPKLLNKTEKIFEKIMTFTQCNCGAHDCGLEFKDNSGELHEFSANEINNYDFECPEGLKYKNVNFRIKYRKVYYEYENFNETIDELIWISKQE